MILAVTASFFLGANSGTLKMLSKLLCVIYSQEFLKKLKKVHIGAITLSGQNDGISH